ncbi:MAG: Clp protease ClpP [Fusobacterium sp.]|uniref:head maturation protease, ClpP-related n=1 Tax=Fusobacterium sp. TaxID=68766 RepID=UPI002A7613AB|nr:head maturation protease, ClpP-related [Fusobacterium sp.]MDY2980187.1 Clp protease ClpP [Fusobacterium sp.]
MSKIKDEKRFGSIKAMNRTDTTLEVCIYGDIVATEGERRNYEDVSPVQMKEFLEYAGNRELDIYINSIGGDAYAGIGIYNMLKAYPQKKRVYIEGLAGSISSVIAFVGDEIYMPANSSLMIHNAWAEYVGTAKEFEKVVEYLQRLDDVIADIYCSKIKNPEINKEKILEMMSAETWFSGTEASQIFNIEVTQAVNIYAMINDEKRFKHIPKNLLRTNDTQINEKLNLEKEKLNLLLMMEG